MFSLAGLICFSFVMGWLIRLQRRGQMMSAAPLIVSAMLVIATVAGAFALSGLTGVLLSSPAIVAGAATHAVLQDQIRRSRNLRGARR